MVFGMLVWQQVLCKSLAPYDVSEGCGLEIVKLEDVGSGIVDSSGVEEAFRLLRIMENSEPAVIQS
jgi:hypothetical protein